MLENTSIDQLIYLFSKLPGLGNRSARRIVLHLLEEKDLRLKSLIEGLISAAEQIQNCSICNNIDYNEICNICSSKNRDTSVIAIVETVSELWAIERSEVFKGYYHVLGKSYKNISDNHHTTASLAKLLDRCKSQNTQEIIIATNSTLDGQTMAYFITEYFKEHSIKTSRLANGIPFGGELDYLDEGTLSIALEQRYLFS
ncbi:recombination mediator RecR [Rickettsia endosymbiont of Cardiosporidium cionae]|uniref:recombination mediator RecR n=1 Tax=Rickettsia endosymbiont of Cardiosporidium cionae TaxID=2777155 RepID=UPI0018959E14|nr:recombination mediator RecR [Rickettsia endosymbiont of Cardiosporidium cionae]KAF8818680.1 recombination protein RecR [Rickettsia endosymbiont of Cardiosporidium cionae]